MNSLETENVVQTWISKDPFMNSRIKVPTCTFVNSTLTSLIQLIIKFSFKNRCDAILGC